MCAIQPVSSLEQYGPPSGIAFRAPVPRTAVTGDRKTSGGTSAISGWTLAYAYAGSQPLQDGWNGTWSRSGGNGTVKSADGNRTIAPDAGVTTSADSGCSGTNAAPANFAVNGTVCGGAHRPPPPVLTSPVAGIAYTAGGTVPPAVTAVAADSATITKVEFYSDITLLSTGTTAALRPSPGRTRRRGVTRAN